VSLRGLGNFSLGLQPSERILADSSWLSLRYRLYRTCIYTVSSYMPVLETTCESGQSRRYMLATPAKLAGCKEAPCFYLTLLAVFVLQTGQLVIFVCSPCRTMRYQQVKTSNELFEISLTLKVGRFCIDCARNTTSSRWKHLPRGRIWMHTAAITKCRDNTHHSGIPSAASPTLLYQVPLVLLNFWDVKL